MACWRAAVLARRGSVTSYVSSVIRAQRGAPRDGSRGSGRIPQQQCRESLQQRFPYPAGSGGNTYVTNASSSRLTSEFNSAALLKQSVSLQFSRGYASDLPAHQEIGMPSLSPTMTQGNIATWKKKEGDQVAAGDVLCEIETDKATLEMESMEEGFLAKIIVPDGGKDIQVGQAICIMVESKDDIPKFSDYKGAAGGGSPPPPKEEAPPKEEPKTESAPPPPPPPKPAASKPSSPPPSSGGRIFASPAAKKFAADKNVPLASIKGTGPDGHILKADIVDYIASGASAPKQEAPPAPSAGEPPAQKPAAPLGGGMDYSDIPNDQIRRVTARRLLQSKQSIPHYYLSLDTRVDKLLALREQLNQAQIAAKGKKLSLNDFVIKAAALATRKVPACNSSWTDDFIRQYHNVNISVAVQTEHGLLVPVVRDADKKGLSGISDEVKTLAEKARSNSLKPSDYEGGTFTISNLGGPFGVKQFSAVINPPQVCILAVGTTEKRVVPGLEAGEFLPGMFMSVTLSCDHRVVDGAIGAQWLGAFKGYIEDPMTLLL